jgi:hypothetical protein
MPYVDAAEDHQAAGAADHQETGRMATLTMDIYLLDDIDTLRLVTPPGGLR